MKKVLIATTNNDKYNAVSKIFKKTIFNEKEFSIIKLTSDMNLPDEKEEGNNINRAKVKALNAYNYLKDYDFDYIVGLDDAVRIKGGLEPNIKEYLNKILFENYIDDGELYAFNRAYCIIDKKGNTYEFTADIPYIYHPLKNDIELKAYTYPLSKVSYPIGYDVPIEELNEEDEINYYLKYVKDEVTKIKIGGNNV